MPNPLTRLHALGQSVWLDYIRRDMIGDGTLDRLIREDALSGMTSNPSIFEKAIADSDLYDDDVREGGPGLEAPAIFEHLAVTDVRAACDRFLPVHEASGGHDGYVSIEVSPGVANDTRATIEEVRRLWSSLDRPNVMVKIPGTAEGIPAIRDCLAEGININITLLFSVDMYRAVMDAWFDAMETRVANGDDVSTVTSVASFFVSRVDSKVDKALDAIVAKGGPDAERARALRGKIAIANAKVAYAAWRERFSGPAWEALEAAGATVQRPLWASTSTKDPAYPDVYYVEALIGPETVNTLPPETIDAYRDHGDPRARIEDGLDAARADLAALGEIGIDLDRVTVELEEEGVRKFSEAYDSLIATIAEKRRQVQPA